MTNENNHELAEALKKRTIDNFEKLDPKEKEEWMALGKDFMQTLSPIFLRHLVDWAKKNGYEEELYNEFALMLQEDYDTFADVYSGLLDSTVILAKTVEDPDAAKKLKTLGLKTLTAITNMYEGDFPDAFDPSL